MPVSVRLDSESEKILRRIAKRTGRSNSAVIRDAIRQLAESEPTTSGDSVYDRISDLAGIARGGNRQYSGRTEEVLREIFARRPRRK